ncbi:uncharacterized protein B0T23DRAFT_421390 [Neurospora hispaniola]|uniref:Cytochrome b561 domain-containing protein n=1 Tax=Neurospora hispaniola TaxID=588809 RepID=A0AAJ0I6P2_9PEZI|nr:hypothetical protein B0T23DRAFT_421390 [Neurospora hispaniola]
MARLTSLLGALLLSVSLFTQPLLGASTTTTTTTTTDNNNNNNNNNNKVQYCQTGLTSGAADFCLSLFSLPNTTTASHDIYFHLTITRWNANGWTAIGTGQTMAGALMFIVYGDPVNGTEKEPVVSVRTVEGHRQPQLIDDFRTVAGKGFDVQVLASSWKEAGTVPPASKEEQGKVKAKRHDDHDEHPIIPAAGTKTYIADVLLACYSCSLWSSGSGSWRTSISATSASQPFLWAWNDRQDFSGTFPRDAHLKMHRHHGSETGGYGFFWADMTRSILGSSGSNYLGKPTVDDLLKILAIVPDTNLLGTSTKPLSASGWLDKVTANPLPKTHAFFMTVAFLILFPLGVILIRSSGNAFQKHWLVQALASIFTLAGAGVGLYMTGRHIPSTVHQWLGLAVTFLLVVQVILGWRHHVDFLRIRRRTWISHGHIWLGRWAVVAGWVNVVLGLLLSGHSRVDVWGVGIFMGMEAVVVAWWVWRAAQRKAIAGENGGQNGKGTTMEDGEVESHALMARNGGAGADGEYFRLSMSEDDLSSSEDEEEGKRGDGVRGGR